MMMLRKSEKDSGQHYELVGMLRSGGEVRKTYAELRDLEADYSRLTARDDMVFVQVSNSFGVLGSHFHADTTRVYGTLTEDALEEHVLAGFYPDW